jgi:hypothetical protein
LASLKEVSLCEIRQGCMIVKSMKCCLLFMLGLPRLHSGITSALRAWQLWQLAWAAPRPVDIYRCQAPPQQNLSQVQATEFLATTHLLKLTRDHPPPHTTILLTMADTDFHDLERIGLLTDIQKALKKASPDGNVPSTVWSYLWLSDIDKLKTLAQNPHLTRLLLITGSDKDIVLMCEFIGLYTFL